MNADHLALLKNGVAAYLGHYDDGNLEPVGSFLPYDFKDEVNRYQWRMMADLLVNDELREVTNILNGWQGGTATVACVESSTRSVRRTGRVGVAQRIRGGMRAPMPSTTLFGPRFVGLRGHQCHPSGSPGTGERISRSPWGGSRKAGRSTAASFSAEEGTAVGATDGSLACCNAVVRFAARD